MLAVVMKRTNQLHGRRRLAVAMSGLAATGLLITVVSLVPEPGRVEVTTGGAPVTSAPPRTDGTTTTTVSPKPEVATSATTARLQQRPPSTVTTRPPAKKPVAASTTSTTSMPTTTTLTCRNSRDSNCGPFYWDPAPDNQPMTVEVELITSNPTVGQIVEFRVVASDDSDIDRDCVGTAYGDDKGAYCARSSPSCRPGPSMYGAWSPPEKQIDRYEKVFSHIYDKAGTYTASFTLRSKEGCDGPNPYRSEGTESVTFSVG